MTRKDEWWIERMKWWMNEWLDSLCTVCEQKIWKYWLNLSVGGGRVLGKSGWGEGTSLTPPLSILNITEIIIFTSCNHTGLVLTQSYFHEEIFVFLVRKCSILRLSYIVLEICKSLHMKTTVENKQFSNNRNSLSSTLSLHSTFVPIFNETPGNFWLNS